jgi:glycosyltransferase involved in cell wall biosynthesis
MYDNAMRILVAHNHYQQAGGEDTVFENEVCLLRSAGHDVEALIVTNDHIRTVFDKAKVTLRTVDNPVGAAAMRTALRRFAPELVHVHNFFPLLSPAVYQISRDCGSAVVQTLHNYRPICAGGQLLRNGKPCTLCSGRSPLWSVVHRCYRGSVIGSAAVARMIAVHRRRGTWSGCVDRYIALTNSARQIFVESGFPSARVTVKPNFVEDPGVAGVGRDRSGVLFVGRLSEEKGVATLIDAAREFGFPVRIAGSGPQRDALQRRAPPAVTFLGAISKDAVIAEMRHAVAVVVPSIWYEGFPMVVVESFACATPVVAANLGALAEIVEDGKTGVLAAPGDSISLGGQVMHLLAEPALARQLGEAARRTFLAKYTPEVNLKRLEIIYAEALSQRQSN